eukprot:g68986.t1
MDELVEGVAIAAAEGASYSSELGDASNFCRLEDGGGVRLFSKCFPRARMKAPKDFRVGWDERDEEEDEEADEEADEEGKTVIKEQEKEEGKEEVVELAETESEQGDDDEVTCVGADTFFSGRKRPDTCISPQNQIKIIRNYLEF